LFRCVPGGFSTPWLPASQFSLPPSPPKPPGPGEGEKLAFAFYLLFYLQASKNPRPYFQISWRKLRLRELWLGMKAGKRGTLELVKQGVWGVVALRTDWGRGEAKASRPSV
jgi:hypothetical protein